MYYNLGDLKGVKEVWWDRTLFCQSVSFFKLKINAESNLSN